MQKRKTCALVNLKISRQVSRDSKEKRAINQMYEMYEILQWKENIKISKMFHADPVDSFTSSSLSFFLFQEVFKGVLILLFHKAKRKTCESSIVVVTITLGKVTPPTHFLYAIQYNHPHWLAIQLNLYLILF